LERVINENVPEMTYYVSGGMLNIIHSLCENEQAPTKIWNRENYCMLTTSCCCNIIGLRQNSVTVAPLYRMAQRLSRYQIIKKIVLNRI